MKTFKLCYIEGDGYTEYGIAYFTDNFEKQWGDDWDDAPYEHNAEAPYHEWSEKAKDSCHQDKWIHHPIEIKKIYFELNDYKTPCSGTDNSPYSVQDINKGVVAWIWNNNFKLFGGATMTEFIDTIKDNGGKIYTEEI